MGQENKKCHVIYDFYTCKTVVWEHVNKWINGGLQEAEETSSGREVTTFSSKMQYYERSQASAAVQLRPLLLLMLLGTCFQLVTGISGQHIGSIFKGQAVKAKSGMLHDIFCDKKDRQVVQHYDGTL